MSKPLLLLEGIFGTVDSVIPVVGEPQLLAPLLGEWVDHSVEVHLHHFPPGPPDQTAPGGGSCLWGQFCPHGHRERPGWLFHQKEQGLLEGSHRAGWTVGGKRLRFDLMPGHHGRFVLVSETAFDEPVLTESQSPDDLIREAEDLVSLLAGLQRAVKT